MVLRGRLGAVHRSCLGSRSTQKVCQRSGEIDYQTGKPTVSQTQTNYGLAGDDLGASLEHNGKLWFPALFLNRFQVDDEILKLVVGDLLISSAFRIK